MAETKVVKKIEDIADSESMRYRNRICLICSTDLTSPDGMSVDTIIVINDKFYCRKCGPKWIWNGYEVIKEFQKHDNR